MQPKPKAMPKKAPPPPVPEPEEPVQPKAKAMPKKALPPVPEREQPVQPEPPWAWARPAQAAAPLTPAQQFLRPPAPWNRRVGRVPEPAGPPPGGQEGRVPEPAGPPPGSQKGRVPEPAGPPPGGQKGRVPEPPGPPPGRVPAEPMGPPPEKTPGKTKLVDREPQPLQEPPAKKKSVLPASAPARPMTEQQEMQPNADSFRKALDRYEIPKFNPFVTPQSIGRGRIDKNLVGKGRKGKHPASPSPVIPKSAYFALKGQNQKGQQGGGVDPNNVGKGRPGEPHPAMLKHIKTKPGGIWLDPPPQEDDELVDVVVDEEEPVPPGPEMEEEGQGRVPAEEEMFQDLYYRTSVRKMQEEEGQGRVPEEEEEEEPLDQYPWHTAASQASSSWVHVNLFDEERADRADSQAATLKLGDHLIEEEEFPEQEDVEMPDPIVHKVMSELESMTMETDLPANAVTMPVGGPGAGHSPFLPMEEDLGAATGPEGRVPRGQTNKMVRKKETEEEKTLRALRARIPTSKQTVTLSKFVGLSNRARLPQPVPEGQEFDPNFHDRQFNGVTATVITQLLMAVHEITLRECDSNGLEVNRKDRDFGHFSLEGFENRCCVENA